MPTGPDTELILQKIRSTIDSADELLLKALSERFRILRYLKTFKVKTGMKVENAARETELKDIWRKKAKDLDLPPELTLLILDFILAESKRIQSA